ncbi:MAG: AAA family ATPase, partial [Sciscionella sp.]
MSWQPLGNEQTQSGRPTEQDVSGSGEGAGPHQVPAGTEGATDDVDLYDEPPSALPPYAEPTQSVPFNRPQDHHQAQYPPGPHQGGYPAGNFQGPPVPQPGQDVGPPAQPGHYMSPGHFPNGPSPYPGPPPGYPQQNPYAPQGPPPQSQPNDLARQAAQAVQDLSSAQLLRNSRRAPRSGWRKAVYMASGRTVNLGESSADMYRRELIARVNQPLRGCYKIAMLSLKGGVGKTTTTTTLGSTFASLRGDRVIAVDANPDRGTLSQKIPLETTATVRHLLRDANRITRYSDVRSYTSQGPSRLEVLASEQDPAVSEAFSESDYRRTIDLLEHFYNIVLTDCGTGLMHSAMKGVLDIADSLVIVSSSSIDGAR